MRILLIKTSSLGDVIHNLPVVNDILQHYPHAQIDWVVEESFADIPRLHPKVNQVFTVAIRRWRKHLSKRQTWCEIRQTIRAISTKQYDVVIDTQGLIKSGVIARLAHGARHGYDKHSIREPMASVFYETKHAIRYQQHAVVRNRALVALSLSYPIPTNAPDYGLQAQLLNGSTTAKNLSELTLPTAFAIGLHGTSRDSKLWPETEWVALGKLLAQRGLSLLLPWASSSEFERATRIASSLTLATVLPKLSITELAKVIVQADVAIGVDTGLSHLAAALDVPTVAIYTDTTPALTGVMPGPRAQVTNLGGVGQTPSHQQVLASLANIASLDALR